MKRTLKIFTIPAERIPAGPPDPPIEKEVEASTMDGLFDTARKLLKSEGYRIRSLSFSSDAMVAYVEVG